MRDERKTAMAHDGVNWSLLIEGCRAFGIDLTENQVDLFQLYYTHLDKMNRVMNLTAITTWQEVIAKHFLDSLSIAKYMDLSGNLSVIDIGTGAGFPGIPLKIVYPGMQVTLVDSLNKRIRFLDEVIALCGLSGIRAVHARAEELGRDRDYREQYDLCASRAVANLSSLCEYCLPFVKKGGVFAAYKSAEIGEELKKAKRAVRILGGELRHEPEVFELPGSDQKRTIVLIDKKEPTPSLYPRKPGTPAKNPL